MRCERDRLSEPLGSTMWDLCASAPFQRQDSARGGPEGTAPFRFTRQVAVYDPLLIVAMAASAARRDLDLNQVRREEHALDSGRRVRIPLDDEVLVDVGVHRDLGKLVRLR